MGPVPKILSVVLLVGCFVLSVAAAGEPEGGKGTEILCEGPYKGLEVKAEELATVLRNHQAWLQAVGRKLDQKILEYMRPVSALLSQWELWLEAERELNDTRRANLCQAILIKANLENAKLSRVNFQGAILVTVNFQGANLPGADFQRAYLSDANLQSANLSGANIEGANLSGANLQSSDLAEANLQSANLSRAKLTRVIYEPTLESLPRISSLLDNRLEDMVFHTSPAALLVLREAFKKAGMRTQERQLTYAVKHTERLQAWDPSIKHTWRRPIVPLMTDKEVKARYLKDTRPWLERLAGKSESLFNYVLFELPSGYGLAPGRALWGLLGLIPIFALPYWIALKRANSRSGIWMIVPADRLAGGRGKEKAALIRPHGAKTWWEHLVAEYRMFRTSLYFSLLSTFHLGWREFNVGTWIARMQSREYTLRATGWVRTVSGIQSLLSVYLLALWVLTYFGRPFE